MGERGWVIVGLDIVPGCELTFDVPLYRSLHPPVEDQSALQQPQPLTSFAPSFGIAPATVGIQPDSVGHLGYMEAADAVGMAHKT